MQLGGGICGRLDRGCSWIRPERYPASSPYPRFRFREDVDELWRIYGRCIASIRSAQRRGNRSNKDTYFPALIDIACWREERYLHFLDMIAFGYRLLAKVFYRLQAYASANGLLFLNALRPLSYRLSAQTAGIRTPSTLPRSFSTRVYRRLFLVSNFA